MSTYSQHYHPYQEQPVFIDPHAFGYGQYDNRRSKTPTDSLINHTGHSPGPLATPPLASRNLSQQLELPQDQPPEYMQWENDSSSTSPTSVRTPDGSSFEGEMTDFSPTYHHNGNTMSTQSSYHSIPAVDSSMILSDQAVQAAFNATMAEAQQYQQQYAMQTQHSHYTSPLHPQTNMFNQNYTTQPPRHDPWNGQAPSRSSMVPRSGHVVFDPASDHINYSDYLIDVDSWAAQYTDPSSLISPSEPTTSFQGDLYFPQGQNHPHHSYDHVPRTQLPTHQSIEMQLTRASPPPNQQSEKAYANQSTPGEPKLYKTAYGDTAEREFFIPGFLDLEHPVDAMGDTGANRNTMDVSFVRKRGYNIDCKAASIVRVGQGRVKTVGVVHVPFRFRGETTSYLLTFHVLPKCPQDVILGSTFLRLTKTFSNAAKFARRVFDRFVLRTSRHYNMLYLGGGGPTFTGTIGGRPHEALADTGSKVLIMDEDFARSRGLPIVDAEEHRIKLRFADGSTARTSGMTQGVTWQFGLAHEGKSFLLDFYILKDAPSNVILSENFLLRESQAFTEYSDYLLDDYEQEEDEEEGHVFVIRKETSLQYKGQYNGADQLCNDIAWDQEMDLRRNEDYRISVIYDAAARGAAEAAERLRRRQWENVHIITQTVQAEYAGTTSQDPPGASGVQPSGGGGVQPQATAQQNSSGANQTPSRPDALAGSSNTIPPSSRRDKFLKRFGRKRKQIT